MSEKIAVQYPMLRYTREIGWNCVRRTDALRLRGGESSVYFTEVVQSQLLNLNPEVVNAQRAAEIVRQLNLLSQTIEGNRDALSWLRGEGSVFVPTEKRERNVHLVDFDDPDNNVFQVTYEWRQKSIMGANRADVVFLINGIPVAIAETKSAERSDGLAEGVDQIRRYHQETPELFVPTQVFEVTQMLDFYYGATWSTNRKNIFNWKEEEPGDYERKIKTFFDRERFLKVLRDYIIFLSRDDQLSKIILRQHQIRAVEKVLRRIYDPVKRRGLIWHTQGSGKTLTMITIASKLLRSAPDVEKPTVLMIVDRNELESQLFKNIAGVGIQTAKIANSKRELRNILTSDYRGLIVSMIHKFDAIPVDINTRRNIIVLVDEAHRTTGGDLGNYLMAALPNASYIGFTGTPVDRLSQGKGTFKVFGVDDKHGYLDKYSIAESIEDGMTVQLNYALAPSDLRVDYVTLEREFLNLRETEGISDIEELNHILNRAVKLKEVMKAPDRVDKIAQCVAQHFNRNVEPMGFKAFLVGVDREACALYKNALDKYLPPEYSTVVCSSSVNDKPLLKKFYLSEDDEKDVRKAFIKKGAMPKILVITEKLLTGFDAPILYCMYLDKPMRDHVLLQAIARVNRPYEDEDGLVKPYGFVLDFVGIFEKLEKALAFDSDVVASVIQNIDELKTAFKKLMTETASAYMPIAHGWDDKAKERAIEYFAHQERREAFFKFFRHLQNLYDIISPDAFLGPFMGDYLELSELYGLIRNAFGDRTYVDKELTAKTKELLRQQGDIGWLDIPGAIHELGPAELRELSKSDLSTTTKVINLRKKVQQVVRDEGDSKPFLQPIGERAAVLEEAYDNRILGTIELLHEYEKLAAECAQADDERLRLNLDENTFAIYTVLKLATDSSSETNAEAINAMFAGYADYKWDEKQESALRAELYKTLLPVVGKKNLFNVTNALVKIRRV
jgi:type I restriction enzyme R subunit